MPLLYHQAERDDSSTYGEDARRRTTLGPAIHWWPAYNDGVADTNLGIGFGEVAAATVAARAAATVVCRRHRRAVRRVDGAAERDGDDRPRDDAGR